VADLNAPPADQLAATRALLHTAERTLVDLRGDDVRDRELGDALSRIQEAHAILWRRSRRLAGDETLVERAPLTMDIAYVAWVLAERRVDHWTADLLRLFAKADPGRRVLLAKLFPKEAAALDAWSNSPFGDLTYWKVVSDPGPSNGR
jgi:hypothetical protein